MLTITWPMQLETTGNVCLAFYKQYLNWKVFVIVVDNSVSTCCACYAVLQFHSFHFLSFPVFLWRNPEQGSKVQMEGTKWLRFQDSRMNNFENSCTIWAFLNFNMEFGLKKKKKVVSSNWHMARDNKSTHTWSPAFNSDCIVLLVSNWNVRHECMILCSIFSNAVQSFFAEPCQL